MNTYKGTFRYEIKEGGWIFLISRITGILVAKFDTDLLIYRVLTGNDFSLTVDELQCLVDFAKDFENGEIVNERVNLQNR